MKNEKIFSVVLNDKIYFVDESGNFYDQIIQKPVNGLGFIKRLNSNLDNAIASYNQIDLETATAIRQDIQNQTATADTTSEPKSLLDRIRSGTVKVQEVGDTVKNLFNKDQNIDPNNTGVVQSGAYANEAGQVYQNAGMSFDFNNKWVMIGGGLLAVGVIFYFINSSGDKTKANGSKKGLSGAGKIVSKKMQNKASWEKAYNYAKNKYGGSQHILDVPADKGKMSFTYTNNKGETVRKYY